MEQPWSDGALRRVQRGGMSIGIETARCCALGLLGRLLRNSVQHGPACFRHDSRAGFARAGRAARLLRRTGRLRDLSRLWIAGYSRLLPRRFRLRAAVSQRAAHGVEKGLALASPLAVLTSVWRHGLSPSPSSICRRSPLVPPAPFRCTIRSTSRGLQTASAIRATRSPTTTTSPPSPPPPPP